MKTLRIVCNFLLSLVQALFPRGLKGRHSCPGDPVAGADSTVVASSEADGGGAGSHRRDLVDHPSGESAGDPSATESALEEPPPATTAGMYIYNLKFCLLNSIGESPITLENVREKY